jgi:hypothetical protein
MALEWEVAAIGDRWFKFWSNQSIVQAFAASNVGWEVCSGRMTVADDIQKL